MNNRKENDKYSLAFCLDRILPHHDYVLCLELYKRAELFEKLMSVVIRFDFDIMKLITSDYTREKVEKYLNKIPH
jgi:hypothetical protein